MYVTKLKTYKNSVAAEKTSSFLATEVQKLEIWTRTSDSLTESLEALTI